MFDWIAFVLLANILFDCGTEESIRSGISRLYYGFFGISRRYLINVKDKYDLMGKSSDVHTRVFDELHESDDVTENEVANILNELRSIRNKADYDSDEEYNQEYFENFLKEYEKDLIVAFEALEYLKTHPNY